jgi:hypothetical protein
MRHQQARGNAGQVFARERAEGQRHQLGGAAIPGRVKQIVKPFDHLESDYAKLDPAGELAPNQNRRRSESVSARVTSA